MLSKCCALFVTAAERSHASYTTSTTCNLRSFLDYLFVSTSDACLKETCRIVCKAEEHKPGHSTPGQPSQVKSKPGRSSQVTSSQVTDLAWADLAWGDLAWGKTHVLSAIRSHMSSLRHRCHVPCLYVMSYLQGARARSGSTGS